MSWTLGLAAVTALLVIVYLVFVLFHPARFS